MGLLWHMLQLMRSRKTEAHAHLYAAAKRRRPVSRAFCEQQSMLERIVRRYVIAVVHQPIIFSYRNLEKYSLFFVTFAGPLPKREGSRVRINTANTLGVV